MAASTVHEYSWMDADAPNPTTSNQKTKGLLHTLKACLVDGYGSTAAAGWTLEHWDMTEGKERAAFGNGNGILEVISAGAEGVAFVIHESVSEYGIGNTYYDRATPETLWSTGVNTRTDPTQVFEKLETQRTAITYTAYFSTSYITTNGMDSTWGWRLFATDKSFWFVMFPSPNNHATNTALAYLPIFAGALEHPVMARDAIGNFAVGSASFQNNSTMPSSGHASRFYYYQLTTLSDPFGDPWTISDVIGADNARMHETAMLNPNSAYKPHMPIYMVYKGDKTPDADIEAKYLYAILPGIRQTFTTSTNCLKYLAYYKGGYENNYAPLMAFDGFKALPMDILSSSNGARGQFFTTNPAHWA